MKHLLITAIILCMCMSLSAQINPMTPSKEIKGQSIGKPVLADIALTKCERYEKYHKLMWKTLLNANPSSSNPLELTKVVRKLRFKPGVNATGHLIVDKIPGALVIPPITQITPLSGYNPYPVPVTGCGVLVQSSGSNSTLSFYWESGNYGTIKEITNIYKIGNQHYVDAINSNGVTHSIKIFINYLTDGCALPTM